MRAPNLLRNERKDIYIHIYIYMKMVNYKKNENTVSYFHGSKNAKFGTLAKINPLGAQNVCFAKKRRKN